MGQNRTGKLKLKGYMNEVSTKVVSISQSSIKAKKAKRSTTVSFIFSKMRNWWNI